MSTSAESTNTEGTRPEDRRKIVFTGATGHVGQALLRAQRLAEFDVHLLARDPSRLPKQAQAIDATVHPVADLATADPAALAPVFADAQTVVHMAARIVENGPADKSDTVRMAEVVGAATCAAAVPRLLHLGSISATQAEQNAPGKRAYGERKLAAEQALFAALGPETRLVTLRPPAVYGENMGGPLAQLTGLIRRHVPLPLARATAPRDYISFRNLTDLILTLLSAPPASWESGPAGQQRIYEPCDGTPVATRDLVSMIAAATNRRAHLFPVPAGLLRLAGNLAGKSSLIEGALDPLTARGNAALATDFGWHPVERLPKSLDYLRNSPGRSI